MPVLVERRQVGAMQRIQMLAARGFVRWLAGEVPRERLAALVEKFDALYGVAESDHAARARAARGEARSRMTVRPATPEVGALDRPCVRGRDYRDARGSRRCVSVAAASAQLVTSVAHAVAKPSANLD